MLLVNLILTKENLPSVAEFYCIRCKALMFKSNRDLLTIWTGTTYPSEAIPKNMALLEYKCRNCPTTYSTYYQ